MSDLVVRVDLPEAVQAWLGEPHAESHLAANLQDALFLIEDPEGPTFDLVVIDAAALHGAGVSAQLMDLRRELPVLLVGAVDPELAAHSDATVRVQDGEARFYAACTEARSRWSLMRREQLLAQVEAVGQLAGGTAHDFNNILTVVLGNLELIELTSQDPKIQELVRAALTAAESASRMTARLGKFSNRRGRVQAQDINALGLHSIPIIARHLDDKYDVRASLQQGEIAVEVDETRVEKILVNLATNAAEAMAPGGRITVETSTRPLQLADPRFHVLSSPVPESYVVVTVRDEGEGMTRAVLRDAGNLFFSTRDRGRSAGVGLSISLAYTLMEGGTIVLESEPGKGTAVHCLFPMPHTETIIVEDVARAGADSSPLQILLLDDDELVGASTEHMLRELGHSVVRVPSSMDALRNLKVNQEFGLALLDIQMPGDMDGVTLARTIGEAFPRLPILLFTGSTAHVDGVLADRVLRKPFTLRQLEDAIRKAMPF